MEVGGAPAEVLLQRPWLPVSIGGCQLLAKSWFGETAYHVLLTDVSCVWEERMDSSAIQRRAKELNRRLQAEVEAFFSHLCDVVRPCLTGSDGPPDGDAHISLARQPDGNMRIKLKSKLEELPFHWEFHCTPAPVPVVCGQLVRPLLAMSHLLQRQVEQLGGLLGRKDAEIQDYRENGATLSRERLQTHTYEEETYREEFMSKTGAQTFCLVGCRGAHRPAAWRRGVEASRSMAATGRSNEGCRNLGEEEGSSSSSSVNHCLSFLASEQSEALGFNADLQRLYAAVVARGNARKRKLSEEQQTAAVAPCLGGSVSSEAGEGGKEQAAASKMADRPGAHQSVPVLSNPPARPSSKPKKKKAVGLFR
uniref:non-homologous end-joining factor 1 n=1 Tax=Gasterosteus aculeatus aculeatus TaxID=481459 RepID=UPI001A9898D4|nr:non-homologous end-joining factor 1 [Gasterosteus aculeatus aculeatus]